MCASLSIAVVATVAGTDALNPNMRGAVTGLSINNLTDADTLVARDLPTTADSGQVISFKVLAVPGYYFKGEVEAYTGADASRVDIPVSYNTTTRLCSFTMPTENISIKLKYDLSIFVVTRASSAALYIDTVRDLTAARNVGNNDFTTFKNRLEVSVKSTDQKRPTGVRVNKTVYPVSLNPDTLKYSAIFDAHPSDMEIDIVTETIYRDITINNGGVVGTLSVEFFNKVGEEYIPLPINDGVISAVADDIIYMKFTCSDADPTHYVPANIVFEYMRGSSMYQDTTTKLEADGYYSYKVQGYDQYSMSYDELDAKAYEGKPFVGNYAMQNVYANNNYSSTANRETILSKYASIAASGAIVFNQSSLTAAPNYSIKSLDETNQEITMKSSSDQFLNYSGVSIFSSWISSGSGKLTNSNPFDLWYGVKMLDGLTDATKYKTEALYSVNAGSADLGILATYYTGGAQKELVTVGIIDFVAAKNSSPFDVKSAFIFDDVTIDFTAGDSVQFAASEFTVSVGGNLFATFANRAATRA